VTIGGDMVPTTPQPGSLAGVLNILIDRTVPGMSNEKIVRAIAHRTGYDLSTSAFQSYRTGRRVSAQAAAIPPLAEFFGVTPATLMPPYMIIDHRATAVGPASTIAERLNRLIGMMHPPGRTSYTTAELANATAELGNPVDPTILAAVRAGDTDAAESLSLRQLRALTTVLGLSGDHGVAYLVSGDLAALPAVSADGTMQIATDDAASTAGLEATAGALDAGQERLTEIVAVRARGLTPAAVRAAAPVIRQLLDSLRAVQDPRQPAPADPNATDDVTK
jgi:hypothetical protein